MSVKNLWKLLKNCKENVEPSNLKLAVDTSIWIHQYKTMQEKDIVFNVTKRILKLLFYNIYPIFVFDGRPNEQKKHVIEQRKLNEAKKLMRDIINNVVCRTCKIKIRVCKHGGVLRKDIREKIDNEIQERIDTSHNKNWGEYIENLVKDERDLNEKVVFTPITEEIKEKNDRLVGHSDILKNKKRENNNILFRAGDESFTKSNKPKKSKRGVKFEKHFNNKEFGIDTVKSIIDSTEISTKQKLRLLVDLREKRKEALEIDNNSLDCFSSSQIQNLKCRNSISASINKLEKKNKKRISSDCFSSYVIQKDRPKLQRTDSKRKKALVIRKDEEEFKSLSSDEDLESFLDTKNESSEENSINGSYILEDQMDEQIDDLIKEFQSDNVKDNTMYTVYDDYLTSDEENDGYNENSDDFNIIGKNLSSYSKSEKLKGGFFCEVDQDTNRNLEATKDNVIEKIDVKDDFKELLINNEDEEILQLFYNGNASDECLVSNRVIEKQEQKDSINETSDIFGVNNTIKKVIESFNLQIINSPMESDSQCGYMSEQKLVDGVITEDNDVILYGGTVFKNFFRRNKDIEKYSMDRIHEVFNLDRKDLIKIGYVLGSDYDLGIRGIGYKKVIEYIRGRGFDDLNFKNFEKIYTELSVRKIESIERVPVDFDRPIRMLLKYNFESNKLRELFFYIFKLKRESNINEIEAI